MNFMFLYITSKDSKISNIKTVFSTSKNVLKAFVELICKKRYQKYNCVQICCKIKLLTFISKGDFFLM